MDSVSVEPVGILIEQLNAMLRSVIATLPQLGIALIVIILTALMTKLMRYIIGRLLDRTTLRASLQSLFQMLAGLAIWVIGLMVAAVVVFPNLTPSSILTGLGIGTVAIGFAFKDTFENFLAGIIILFRKKMRIGDFIECEAIEGKVQSIAVRGTHIRQTDGQLVVVPNAVLFKNPLTIRTDLDQRRVTVMCGVAYAESVAEARSVIDKAVRACSSVKTDEHEVEIFAQSFGASSIDFEVTWWTGSTPLDVRKSRDEVVEAVKSALDDADIEIPFPYRTLTFAQPLPLMRGKEQEDG